MTVYSPLAGYGDAGDRMFAALVERLRADDRFVGAWLSGSHGRGEDDEWSDFDFHLAVQDDALAAILANPRPLFEIAGDVLLVQANFPSDSMPNGRFWLVVYAGPVHIDWNVGPASAATRPAASKLLFEAQTIPVATEPEPLTSDGARQHAQQAIEFFWAMAPIAVKYAGRGWTRGAVQQEGLLASAFQRLWRLAHGRPLRSQDAYDQNRRPDPRMLAAQPRFGAVIDGAEALRVVAEYCEAVMALHAALAGMGVDVPQRMPAEVRSLLALARAEVGTGASRPGTGSQR